MKINSKIKYWQRIFEAYILGRTSHLSFWHEKVAVNERAKFDQLGEYYMTFYDKTNYQGFFDENGVPKLDYQGKIGLQYNPIAIAQYGLGHLNLYKETGNKKNLETAIKQADWLVKKLEKNNRGISVWMHHFDWEYRGLLKAPWYSALAQGNGLSLLVRIYKETNNKKYLLTAEEAFKALAITIENGGVLFIDSQNNYWLEETIVNPPTHILNGFLWTLWGVWDYYLLTNDEKVKGLFDKGIKTVRENLKNYDIGFWSLYEQSGTKMKMLASRFYHGLHVVQLKITYQLTGDKIFDDYYKKWNKYQYNKLYIMLSQLYKIIFKILYY